PPPPGRRAPNLTPDPSNGAATLSLTEDDIKALREMGIKLDTLVPAGATDAQATDAYTRLGQEALGGGRYGLADQLFQSALGRSPRNTMAQAGRINAVMGLGLLMTAGNDLRDFYTDHPEMIPVRFESTLLMPRARADHLAGLLTADIDKGADGTIANSGLTLAFLGRQFENQAWLDKGLDAMAAQTTGDPQGAELWKVLNAVWRANAKPSPPGGTH
ncbi:MAG: hypothetical protein K2Q09_07735, partial [Phycisphaerales bacterium]|nr:hypothetical protein [Phycisphaerales bacterium]